MAEYAISCHDCECFHVFRDKESAKSEMSAMVKRSFAQAKGKSLSATMHKSGDLVIITLGKDRNSTLWSSCGIVKF